MRRYEDNFNEEYERGFRAGRRKALRELDEEETLTRGQQAKIEREKDKIQRRKNARKLISSFSSDLGKVEELLRYYSRNSDSDFELWKHAKNAQEEINELKDKIDRWTKE